MRDLSSWESSPWVWRLEDVIEGGSVRRKEKRKESGLSSGLCFVFGVVRREGGTYPVPRCREVSVKEEAASEGGWVAKSPEARLRASE